MIIIISVRINNLLKKENLQTMDFAILVEYIIKLEES